MAAGQTKADLLERIKELVAENSELNDQMDSITDGLENLLDIVAPDEADDSDDGEDGEDDGDDQD
jgi:hypothetical protein